MFEEYLQRIILITPPILLALTVHECAHAWVADRLGDPTARMLGRITLNPIKHLDPIGALALFLTGMFGWAKPVPINPGNFKDPARDTLWVSIAGPATNLFLAAVFALIYRLFMVGEVPLSTGGVDIYGPLFIMVELSIVLNIGLAVFNMIPVPPLDGSKVLQGLLPPDKAIQYARLEPYGFLILILLIFTGILHKVISPVIIITTRILTGGLF